MSAPISETAKVRKIKKVKKVHFRLRQNNSAKERVFVRKDYLLTPGPVQVPLNVSIESLYPMIHHRSPEFSTIFKDVSDKLKKIFKTQHDVLCFASTGTGCMEASVVNVLSPNDDVLVIKGGKFGERWAELCRIFGANVTCIDVEWGKAVKPALVEEELSKNPDIKAVFATHCETSTGIINDIESIGKIVDKYPAILVIDAITTIAAHPFFMDAWKIDVSVTGSQKGFMLPAGLACVAVSQKAWDRIKGSKGPRYYWDFQKMQKNLRNDTTSFTPPVSLVRNLSKSLDIIMNEGLEAVWKRHALLAKATRGAVRAMGLQLFAEKDYCNILTAVNVPGTIDGGKLVKLLRDKYGITLTGGQETLKGKIFRIGHLGYVNDFDIIVAIAALERGLIELGCDIEVGKGLTEAQKIFISGDE